MLISARLVMRVSDPLAERAAGSLPDPVPD
jgi:hypothetical protein